MTTEDLHTARTRALGTCEHYEPIVLVRPERINISPEARIDSFVKIEGGLGVRIDRWVHISSFAHINVGGGSVVIEEGAAVASGAKLIGGSNQSDALSMSSKAPSGDQHVERGHLVVSRYAFIGTNATVLPDVTVGEGAVVGAGAVVLRDVAPWTIVFGNPARMTGHRPHVLSARTSNAA